jgi:hypothetical protein
VVGEKRREEVRSEPGEPRLSPEEKKREGKSEGKMVGSAFSVMGAFGEVAVEIWVWGRRCEYDFAENRDRIWRNGNPNENSVAHSVSSIEGMTVTSFLPVFCPV